MIIKGLCRRYERWNPVHPTAGAFWGMGIGIGCGVGWGPGFGPEVIGYVGAGCGIGFSVGITLLGVGVGLPANYIFTVPYNAFMVTRSGALELARSNHLHGMGMIPQAHWNKIGPQFLDLQQKVRGMFSTFMVDSIPQKQIDLSNLRSTVLSRAQPIRDHLDKISAGLFPPK